MKNKLRWFLIVSTMVCLGNALIVSGSGVGNKFIDFNLEDPHETKYSQSTLKDKITLVILQSRTTLQTAVDCKTELKKLI